MSEPNIEVNSEKSKSSWFKKAFLFDASDSKNQKISKVLNWVILIALTCSVLLGMALLFKYGRIYFVAKNYEQIKPIMSSVPNTNQIDEDKDIWHPSSEALDSQYGILPSFVELYKKNTDTVGWITIAGTRLDYPVMQGSDNGYYLSHSLDKKRYSFGVPFIDYRATVSAENQSHNLTIYSHAAKDGSYFSVIKKYSDIDFYKHNPSITFNAIYKTGEYKVVGFFVARVYNDASKQPDPEEFNYHDVIEISSQEKLDAFVDNIEKRSYFHAPVDVKLGDEFITLSTCDDEIINSLKTPYRNVLIARRVRDGESRKVDVSNATENTQMIMPEAWISKFNKINPYH